ncbi:MAG: hypothetical protein Q8K79_05955 [Solirubrobacteraceae bacterium]|nr:hypothetical protein [Solirubrobacteraceae bacterium]
MVAARDNRGVAIRLGGAVALFLLIVGQAQVTVLDGNSMLAVAQSIVHDGSFAVPPALGVPGHDGETYYSKYGLLLPLLSVLPVLLAQPIGALTGRVDLVEAAAAASIMPLVAGALAAALFALARRLGAPRPAAALVAAGIVLGTYLLPYGRDFFTEPLVALGLVVMVERALAGRERQAALALALAVLARPQSAAFVPLLLGFMALRGDGVRAIARTIPPLAVAAIVTVAYNLHRFADPLEFGYRPPVDPGFTTPLPEGTSGLLFDLEKSLVLFAPALLLAPLALAALWRSARATAMLLLALFAVTFVLAATWHSWQGGWSWGPRLVIPGVALVLVALAPWIGSSRRRMGLAGALFGVGFVLSFSAVLAPPGMQLVDRAPGTVGPQIVRQYRELPRLTENSIDAASDRRARDGDYRRYLSLWQANLVRQVGGGAALPALLVTLSGFAALLWLAVGLVRDLRRDFVTETMSTTR